MWGSTIAMNTVDMFYNKFEGNEIVFTNLLLRHVDFTNIPCNVVQVQRCRGFFWYFQQLTVHRSKQLATLVSYSSMFGLSFKAFNCNDLF